MSLPPWVVCYTAVFSVVTQRSSPQTAAENRTTFLSLCVCGLTNKPIMYKKFDNMYVSRRAVGSEQASQFTTNQSSLNLDGLCVFEQRKR